MPKYLLVTNGRARTLLLAIYQDFRDEIIQKVVKAGNLCGY